MSALDESVKELVKRENHFKKVVGDKYMEMNGPKQLVNGIKRRCYDIGESQSKTREEVDAMIEAERKASNG